MINLIHVPSQEVNSFLFRNDETTILCTVLPSDTSVARWFHQKYQTNLITNLINPQIYVVIKKKNGLSLLWGNETERRPLCSSFRLPYPCCFMAASASDRDTEVVRSPIPSCSQFLRIKPTCPYSSCWSLSETLKLLMAWK